MKNNIFISHSSYDKEVVKILAELIKRVSLNQIQIWFSNDTDVKGGFLIGEDWFEAIINNLRKSQVVISFITPNSNNQPWILYESGYAEALNDCILVPAKFSINFSDISIPLQHKQIYNLSGVEDLHTFLCKLLDLFNINYDKEIFQDIVQKYLKRMRDNWKNSSRPDDSEVENKMIERLEQKLDYYFGNMNNKIINQEQYDICILYTIDGKEEREYITINENMTVSYLLDEVYFIISDYVGAYTYLQSWVLTDCNTQQMVILNQAMQNLIPAQNIFLRNSFWQVEFLAKPLIQL